MKINSPVVGLRLKLYQNVSSDFEEAGIENVMYARLMIELPRFERVHNVRRALFFWLLPAISISGAFANIFWLIFWRCRLARRRPAATVQQVGNRSAPERSFLMSFRHTRSPDSAASGQENSRSVSQPLSLQNSPAPVRHKLSVSPNDQIEISNAVESPDCGSDLELRRPRVGERSACALHLELYAVSCVALLTLSSFESLCVSQFHTHPSLIHSAICRLWPPVYHLLLTFPPVILIPSILQKCMSL